MAKYNTRTDTAVKDALLKLLAEKPLAEISVSELARQAKISRSTFYEHYGNPADVYDRLLREVSADLAPITSQIACSSNLKSAGKPFCAIVRDAGAYAPVVGEQRFVDSILNEYASGESHDLHGLLVGAGYTPDEARAICAFQMSGCFNAARKARAAGTGDDEWDGIRAVIDRFILGGIAALLAARK